MTHVFRTPTAIVRSCNSFGSNHPNYDIWGNAGFDTFAFKTTDLLLPDGVASARKASKRIVISVDWEGDQAAQFVARAIDQHKTHAPDALVLELEGIAGLMPFAMQTAVFTALRQALGPELVAPLAIFAPPFKGTWPGALEIDYGTAVDQGMWVMVELYGKTNDVVMPPARTIGAIMAWFNEPAHRFQGVGARRIVPIVSAGQASYFASRLAGAGTRGLFYWCADDDQAAVDAGKYAALFGPQPEKEYVAWS